LGERKIVEEILRRYCDPAIGSDCALLEMAAGKIVVTTDPVPEPAALVIAGDSDLYWRGWLLTTINASDLAAAAASPIAFVAALEAPPDFLAEHFERFVAGIADACKSEGLRYVGGNLKEGPRVLGVGTALGWVDAVGGLGRTGIRAGDLIAVVGKGGEFWSDALFVAGGGRLADVHGSPLFKPRSQLHAMRTLSAHVKIHAAIDNSDGLLPSLQQLCVSNGVAAVLDLDQLPPPRGYSERKHLIEISHQRLWLGWGDWNVVVAVSSDAEPELRRIASDEGFMVTTCGVFTNGPPKVTLQCGGELLPAPRIESERFSADSWFSAGIGQYIQILRSAILPGGL
jgi:thiamine-monophosphate kinase